VLARGTFTLAPPIAVERLGAEADRLRAPAEPVAAPAPAPLVLTPRREPRSMNSAHYADDPAVPRPARVHPDTLATIGQADGTRARLRSGARPVSVEVVLRADPAVRPGAVSIVHGWVGANVADLTSTREGVDVFTGMPQLSGVPVHLEASTPADVASPSLGADRAPSPGRDGMPAPPPGAGTPGARHRQNGA
jgi:hypothetical protein